ncbi:hypothetical protein LSTR_LSTR012447 [Laodelphax striatellus]|uniref:Calmodulin-binding transcription activator 1 n=1 Tax=Laodelphax striatellus TaxID=195883 RepID=A0A482X391_LAOST|nr:hypothetical protein LSTR_LSTR012447 [Laodelphax striatellus]
MDDKLQIKQEPDVGNDTVGGNRSSKQNSFEDRLVSYCQEMCQRPWRNECIRESIDNSLSWYSCHRSMTILHLAAHLGYSRLLRAMLRWRHSNPSLALESEVDALSRDADGMTPLARACAGGHCEAAILLYRWNHTALGVRDDKLRTALDCAREHEHSRLVEEIERLENERIRNSDALTGISSVDCFVSLLHGGNQDILSDKSSSDSGAPVTTRPRREARANNLTAARDDGIFLRPAASQKSSDQLISRQSADHQLINRQSADHQLINRQSADHQLINRQSADHQLINRQSADHMISRQSADHQLINRQSADHQLINRQSADHQLINRQSADQLISRLASSPPVELEEAAASDKNESKMFLGGSDSTKRGQPTTSPGPIAGGTSDRSGTASARSSNNRLFKRQSVDSGIHVESSTPLRNSSKSTSTSRDNPKLSRFDRSMSLPLHSPLSGTDSAYDSGMSDSILQSPIRRMDFTLFSQGESSLPNLQLDTGLIQDNFGQLDMHISDEDQSSTVSGEQEVRVLTLAEQIIAAMPDRIKNESEEMMLLLSSNDSVEVMSMESPLLMDDTPSPSPLCFDSPGEFNFEHSYRYYDVATPASSLSPASSSCLPSPSPSTFPLPDSPSPPPTTADFCEFFHASTSPFEKDFSNLTLSDREQRELYEAAKIIQKAYRSYKGRKKLEEQDKERAAAVLIQNYYRRYKQYAYFKQMTRAAMVIQHGFRSYCEHKRRFKKNKESAAALRIQNYYRNYREQGGGGGGGGGMDGGGGGMRTGGGGSRAGSTGSAESGMTSSGLKRTYSQRRQHQAARKIQQFMRQSKNNVWELGPATMVAERASRKREATLPMSQGCPAKLAPPSTRHHRHPTTNTNKL